MYTSQTHTCDDNTALFAQCQPTLASLVGALAARPDSSSAIHIRGSDDVWPDLLRKLTHALTECLPALAPHAQRSTAQQPLALACLLDLTSLVAPHAEILQLPTTSLMASLPIESLLQGLIQDVRGA